MRFRALLVLIVALLIGCSDGRPDERHVIQFFEMVYPQAELLSIRNTEDEVLARSYEFTYRVPGRPVGRINIQFMKAEHGGWMPLPPAPDSLP